MLEQLCGTPVRFSGCGGRHPPAKVAGVVRAIQAHDITAQQIEQRAGALGRSRPTG